jgi:drug/metabolite transporter (DMT)-like permease
MLYECAIVALIFGYTPIINQYILKHIEVVSFISMKAVFFFIVVLLYTTLTNRNDLYLDIGILNENMHLYPLIILSAVSTMIVANYFYSTLIKNNKAYLVTAIISSYPAITAILGYMLLNETISIKQTIGIFMCITGVFLLVGKP